MPDDPKAPEVTEEPKAPELNLEAPDEEPKAPAADAPPAKAEPAPPPAPVAEAPKEGEPDTPPAPGAPPALEDLTKQAEAAKTAATAVVAAANNRIAAMEAEQTQFRNQQAAAQLEQTLDSYRYRLEQAGTHDDSQIEFAVNIERDIHHRRAQLAQQEQMLNARAAQSEAEAKQVVIARLAAQHSVDAKELASFNDPLVMQKHAELLKAQRDLAGAKEAAAAPQEFDGGPESTGGQNEMSRRDQLRNVDRPWTDAEHAEMAKYLGISG